MSIVNNYAISQSDLCNVYFNIDSTAFSNGNKSITSAIEDYLHGRIQVSDSHIGILESADIVADTFDIQRLFLKRYANELGIPKAIRQIIRNGLYRLYMKQIDLGHKDASILAGFVAYIVKLGNMTTTIGISKIAKTCGSVSIGTIDRVIVSIGKYKTKLFTKSELSLVTESFKDIYDNCLVFTRQVDDDTEDTGYNKYEDIDYTNELFDDDESSCCGSESEFVLIDTLKDLNGLNK
jgi:hypothetical protein